MIALIAWEHEKGWDYLKDFADAEIEIDPEDLPPALAWEFGVFEIYDALRTQWHYTLVGRAAYNYEPALRLCASRGFDESLFTTLLQAIEYAELKADEARRQAQDAKP